MRDIPLTRILDIVLKANVGARLLRGRQPAPRPRMEVCCEDVKLPEGKMLIPGVLDSRRPTSSSTRSWSRERIVRYARLVGRENVIAGTDCGFSTFARSR